VTAPAEATPRPQSLAPLLSLVDASTARGVATEDQLVTESDNLYAQRYAAYLAEEEQPREDDDTHPFLNAALLAAVVVLLRRSFSFGSAEGLRFGVQQLTTAGVSFDASAATVATNFIDSVVQDFLAGQVDVASKASGQDTQSLVLNLAQRARTGVLVAYHGGRGAATEAALASAASQWTGAVHKLWVARFDLETPPCPLCVRLHGTHVAVADDFHVPDDEPTPYLGKLARPPRHPRCRCSLVLYLPTKMDSDSGPTPLSMMQYANQVLEIADLPRHEFVAATMVYIKPYTRVVGGKTQMVDGYYYDVQSGLKVSGPPSTSSPPQKVSIDTAKALTEKATGKKGAAASSSKHNWIPGSYVIDLPGDPDFNGPVHVMVHSDGTSTSIQGDSHEDASPEKTASFLDFWHAQGAVSMQEAADTKDATLPPGHHLLTNHKTFGGVEVHPDGTGKLYSKDFSKTIPIKQKAIQDVSKGHLGKTQPANPEDFTPDWQKTHESAKAADSVPDEIAVSAHPETGHGDTLSQQTLFDVGSHKVAFDEGAQVFRSSSSKDTLYVLGHDGNLTKYNLQGSGVQATVVASSDNPSARAALLAKLDNVSAHGSPIKNAHSVPGTKPVYLGGMDLTSTQIEDAITALNNSPSPAIASVLSKNGSPLASVDVHAVAAPYKAMYNNKTKPAFLHALGLAHQKSGHTPLASTGAVSHLEQHHGMKDHHASLGNSDVASIHAAMHSIDPSGDHDHADAGPGVIDVYGLKFSPELVSAAITALKDEKSTSVKGPLKKAGSPLASADLSGFADGYAGTKLHYSKFKPTLIKALQDSLSQHQKSAPPHAAPTVSHPPTQVEFHGVYGTKADLVEARDFLDSIDISSLKGDFEGKLQEKIKAGPSSNPFLQNLDWVDVADKSSSSGISVLHTMNKDLHDGLTQAIGDGKTKSVETPKVAPLDDFGIPKPKLPVSGPGPQVTLEWGSGESATGSVQQLHDFLAQIEADHADGLTIDDYMQSGASPFTHMNAEEFLKDKLGSSYLPATALADLSVYIQDKLDEVGSPAVTEVVSQAEIQGKLFDKSDLLKAVDLLKAEASTSVKGPLKGELPQLAKVDLKALAEEHAGTKLHYSKLKPAVIAALQAKADELVDPLPEGAPSPETVVTKLVESVDPPKPTSLEKDVAKSTPVPDHTGTWTHSASGASLVVDPDGSAVVTFIKGSQLSYGAAEVQTFISSGVWTKVSDQYVDPPPPPSIDLPPAQGVKLSPPTKLGYGIGILDKPELYALSQTWANDAGFGSVAGQHLKNKKKTELYAWVQAWASGDWDKAYAIESAGLKKHKFASQHPGSPFFPNNKNGFVKPKMAPAVDGEIPAGDVVPGNWPTTFPNSWQSDQIDEYMLAAQMQNSTGLTFWGKKSWVVAHIGGDKAATDSMSLLAQIKVSSGQVYSDPILPQVEKYLPGQAVPLDASWPSFDPSKVAASDLTNLQADKYLSHFGSTGLVKSLTSQPLEVKQQLVQLHYVAALPASTDSFKSPSDAKKQLNDLLDKLEADVSYQSTQDIMQALVETLAIKEHHYTKDPVQPFFGGGSGASMVQVTDESGQTFIFKAAGSPYRADTEHGMHELAKLSGIQAADSRLGTWEGQFGQFQTKLDSKASLTGVPASSLPSSALSDIMRSHVFDWAINNDDAHSENFLLSPDGQHAYPIDFGRGYARFGTGWMRLQLGQLSGQADLYYNKVYSDIVSGNIDDKTTDLLYTSVIKQAQKMASISDSSWSSVLQDAFARRTNFKTTSASNVDELIQQALDRKNNLVSDFEKFWDSIYAKTGRTKPEVKFSLGQHVFTGNSTDWHARSKSVGAAGAATFFSGADLEDSHLLGQVVYRNKSTKTTVNTHVTIVHGLKVGDWYDGDNDITITVNPDGTVDGLASEDATPAEVIAILKDPDSSWEWQGNSAAPSEAPISSGQAEMWLSGQLRENADAKIRSWLTSHYSGNIDVGSSAPSDKTSQLLFQLGINDIVNTLAVFAKTVSHHHKQGDKNYNSLAQSNFDAARQKIDQLLSEVDAGNFPASVLPVDRLQYEGMVRHYSQQAAAIHQLKISGGVSHKGDFPTYDFKLSDPPVVDPPVKSPAKLKVELKPSFIEGGEHNQDGNFVLTGNPENHGSGQVFVVTLDDGTQIEYRSWHPNEGIPLSQKGMLKVKVRNYDGSSGSVEPAFTALRSMGVSLDDSSDEDMELFYWRHLYGILNDRSDTGSYSKVVNSVKNNINPSSDGSSLLPKDAELVAWREAWSHVDAAAVKTFVEKKGYLPRFGHTNVAKPEEIGGQPFWMRFDVELSQLRDSNKMPVRTVSKLGAMAKVVRTGGSYSTEDRPKILGKWSYGMSSSTDQSEGSSNFVFTRINLTGSAYQYYFRPEALARTSNYSYGTDRFGRLSDRKSSAFFNFDKSTSHSGTGNETMIKHALTLLDDMELVGFSKQSERQEAIDFLHSHGIYSIRGLPITDRLVLTSEISTAIKKIKDHRKTWKLEEGDPYDVAL
jgi:hypothetical protein